MPQPDSSGAAAEVVLEAPALPQNYFFAVRAVDERGNRGPISNYVNSTAPHMTRLTRSLQSWGAGTPSYSHDGARILFTADWRRFAHYGAYTMNADGSDVVEIPFDLDELHLPRWSPDGSQVAFVQTISETGYSAWELVVAGADDLSSRRGLFYDEDGPITALDWMPDGKSIVFSAIHWSGRPFRYRICRIAAAGGEPDTLVNSRDFFRGLSCAPDGSTIAFSWVLDDYVSMWTVSTAGGDPAVLSRGQCNDIGPVYSPDGSQLAFSSDRGGAFDIWTMRLTDGALTQRTFDSWNQGDPAWSPDMRNIAFGASIDLITDIWTVPFQSSAQ